MSPLPSPKPSSPLVIERYVEGESEPKPAKKAVTPAKKSPSVKSIPAPLPVALKELEEKYTEAKTLYAEFEQVNENVALGKKQKSTGILSVKQPNKIRWETTKPDPNLLVSNGKSFWFYTPPFEAGEHGQVLERKTSQAQSRLMNALVSGTFSKITRDTGILTRGTNQFLLKPRAGTAGTVMEALIHINPSQKLIERVELTHQGGNKTDIVLSRIELGKDLGDEVFNFSPPPNTDRVSE